MMKPYLIIPERKRVLKPPFAWINRRFLFDGYLNELTANENLLYFFLNLVADRDGLSFYSYEKICQYLEMSVDTYTSARDVLIQRGLIEFENQVFQVLSLPERQDTPAKRVSHQSEQTDDFQTIAKLFDRLNKQKDLS